MTKGEYPKSMRETVGARLPTFTAEQLKVGSGLVKCVSCSPFCVSQVFVRDLSGNARGIAGIPFISNMPFRRVMRLLQLVVGSLDFVALNYYFPYVTSPGTATAADEPSFFKDMNITR